MWLNRSIEQMRDVFRRAITFDILKGAEGKLCDLPYRAGLESTTLRVNKWIGCFSLSWTPSHTFLFPPLPPPQDLKWNHPDDNVVYQ